MRVAFLSQANADFVAAIRFYESEDPGLGKALVEDVERTTELVADFPSIGSPGPRGTRRVHLRRFPFSLVYRRSPDDICVVALEHDSRRPGYWADRL